MHNIDNKQNEFDFTKVNYIDITKDIKKGVNSGTAPSLVTYFFENIDDIPDVVLK